MAAVVSSNGNAPKGKDVALTDLKGAVDLHGDDAPVIIKPVPVVEAKWSYWNLLTFSWMTNIVSEARKRQISQDELVLPEHLGAEKAFLQFDAAWKEESIKDKPSLLKAVENCYWKDFARAALVKGCWSALLPVSSQSDAGSPWRKPSVSKYPKAKPGALVCEPLKAAITAPYSAP